jgi:hypothetical protein
MGSLILLLCSLPPLAVLAVALIHGLRSGSSTVSLTLSLSALIFSAAIVLPLLGDEEPVRSPRFAFQDRDTGTPSFEPAHSGWLVHRSEPWTLYR